METFTRRKPTNEMFSGDMSLKGWIDASWPDAVSEVIDADLMRLEEDLTGMVQCTSLIMEVAFKCSAELPEERIAIGDVLTSLEKIRNHRIKSQHKHER